MALSFLQAVNKSLRRTRIISSDLASFTDAAHQSDITIHLDIWNEVLAELYLESDIGNVVEEGSITLATDTREYSLPSDFERMAGESYGTRVLTNTTDTISVFEYPARSGISPYAAMFADQPDPTDFTGRPLWWAISPKASNIRMDKTPTSGENGEIYKFLYDKRQNLSLITDTFPISDTSVEGLVPVVAEAFRRDRAGEQRDPISEQAGFIRAVEMANKNKSRRSYGPRYIHRNLRRAL